MNTAAFILGFVGSLHCLTMCGPLSMLFSFGGKTSKGVFNSLVYQSARIFVYAVLGALVGWLMKGMEWFGFTQQASLVIGIVLFVFGGVYLLVKPAGIEQSVLGKWVVKLFASLVKKCGSGSIKFLIAGFLNGLLPCGLVYTALAGATLTYSSFGGAQYMLLFGLGTLPAMVASNLFTGLIKKRFSFLKPKLIMPVFLMFTGVLLVVRGLDLGIPYLSPQVKNNQQTTYCDVE